MVALKRPVLAELHKNAEAAPPICQWKLNNWTFLYFFSNAVAFTARSTLRYRKASLVSSEVMSAFMLPPLLR
jgi:hypothetical protein